MFVLFTSRTLNENVFRVEFRIGKPVLQCSQELDGTGLIKNMDILYSAHDACLE